MNFEREKYYSQTEIIKKYKISLKKFQTLYSALPAVHHTANMGLYTVITNYYIKSDIEALNLELRS